MNKSLKEIEKTLKDKGERFTAPRRAVMATLLKHGKAAKAYDIVEMMDDVKPMTVYRALDFLVSQGFAHRIESMNAYAPCAENHCAHKDSQYMICEKCEDITEIHNHALDDFIAAALRKDGFHISSKMMEVHGICKNCAA